MHPASTRIAGLGVYLPETTRSAAQTERDLRAANPRLKIATGLIHRLTGVDTVHLRAHGWQASDLAVEAARIALQESPGHPDLLIFASASQDHSHCHHRLAFSSCIGAKRLPDDWLRLNL